MIKPDTSEPIGMIVTCARDTLYKKISYKNIEAKFAKF